MNEAIRNFVVLVWTLSAMTSDVNAQSVVSYQIEKEAPISDPVMVFGSANLGKGKRDSVLLEQNNEDNPLGNPIIDEGNNVSQSSGAVVDNIHNLSTKGGKNAGSLKVITETLPQTPSISRGESPEVISKEIQNTLYEAGDRIYDVQSIPANDINKIEEPNVNPTITTYPSH